MSQNLYDRIREVLKTSPGRTQKGLAAHMGLNPAAVNRMLHGERNIMADEIPLIEDYLGVRIELSSPSSSPPTVSEKLVPVYGDAAGGLQKGLNLSSGNVVDWVTRHPAQLGITNAFAIYVFSDAMEPRYFRGELVYIHPGRPPEMNRDCVIEMNNGDASIKRFLRQGENKIRVAQFNPPEEKDIPKSEIKAVYAVVGRG